MIDWGERIEKINALYGTMYKGEDLKKALERLMADKKTVLAAVGLLKVSHQTLRNTLKYLKINYVCNSRRKTTGSHIRYEAIEPLAAIDVHFDEERWNASDKDHSPCRHCSNVWGEKNNPTCHECHWKKEFNELHDSPEGYGLSIVGNDSIDVILQGSIGIRSCG